MSSSIYDIKLQTIDFDWIKQTVKISHLKRAITLIEADGNYFTQLKDACYSRMAEIDPSFKKLQFNNHMSQQLKQSIESELHEWESKVQTKQKGKSITETNLQDFQTYFDNDIKNKGQSKKAEIAERERVKGNEAIKSKDFDEAISFYTRSIELDSTMHQSYGNRALAYLKKKQFIKCLDDCEKALAICPTYTKALHRKAKALIHLKRKVEAYRIYKQILRIQPDNSEINQQMLELRQQMDERQIAEIDSSLMSKSQFKKITIEEDSEENEKL